MHNNGTNSTFRRKTHTLIDLLANCSLHACGNASERGASSTPHSNRLPSRQSFESTNTLKNALVDHWKVGIALAPGLSCSVEEEPGAVWSLNFRLRSNPLRTSDLQLAKSSTIVSSRATLSKNILSSSAVIGFVSLSDSAIIYSRVSVDRPYSRRPLFQAVARWAGAFSLCIISYSVEFVTSMWWFFEYMSQSQIFSRILCTVCYATKTLMIPWINRDWGAPLLQQGDGFLCPHK